MIDSGQLKDDRRITRLTKQQKKLFGGGGGGATGDSADQSGRLSARHKDGLSLKGHAGQRLKLCLFVTVAPRPSAAFCAAPAAVATYLLRLDTDQHPPPTFFPRLGERRMFPPPTYD